MSNKIPVFDGQKNFFDVPQNLNEKEVTRFLRAVKSIEDGIAAAGDEDEVADFTFSKPEMSDKIFEAILNLCNEAKYKIKKIQSDEEFVLAITINE